MTTSIEAWIENAELIAKEAKEDLQRTKEKIVEEEATGGKRPALSKHPT
jgi:hypothetical protein